MKSKKTSQGKKETKKIKTSVAKKVKSAKVNKPIAKKTKPVAKKASKPTVAPKASKTANIPLSKPIKVSNKSVKTNNIPDLFKNFYRE